MRGLPYSCTESDITKFFQEIDVTPIRIHRKADGAEAYVEFYNISDTDTAMSRHRSYIGRRYIELFRVTYEDMARTVGLPISSTNIPASALSINSSALMSINPLSIGFAQRRPHPSTQMDQYSQQQQQQHSYHPNPHRSHYAHPPPQLQQHANNNNASHSQQLLLSAANMNALMSQSNALGLPSIQNQGSNINQQQPHQHQQPGQYQYFH